MEKKVGKQDYRELSVVVKVFDDQDVLTTSKEYDATTQEWWATDGEW